MSSFVIYLTIYHSAIKSTNKQKKKHDVGFKTIIADYNRWDGGAVGLYYAVYSMCA